MHTQFLLDNLEGRDRWDLIQEKGCSGSVKKKDKTRNFLRKV
jgi:hypothetical protein